MNTHLIALGIDASSLAARGLAPFEEARELVFVELGVEGRDHFLIRDAADAWHRMRTAARAEGVELILASSFRSIARQAELVRVRLAQGRTLEDILGSVAAPGYSEHHTGRAVDIVSADHPALEKTFETTAAFAWLNAHAAPFGFAMSYPRGNAAGYIYEPWHWYWHDL
ncbi:MAG: M15 family metallopeptidase [Betaproteobacteria bacterium]|nr:M15 family metallopeptidase [Betaproteobacteria bacterium]